MTQTSFASVGYLRYGTLPRQTIKKYTVPALTKPDDPLHIVVFIHGGAWRDVSNKSDDADVMVNHLKSLKSDSFIETDEGSLVENFYSIDYRLLPNSRFPSYVFDAAFALLEIRRYITRQLLKSKSKNVQALAHSPLSVTLAGHSVGATIALQLIQIEDLLLRWIPIFTKHTSFLYSQNAYLNLIQGLTIPDSWTSPNVSKYPNVGSAAAKIDCVTTYLSSSLLTAVNFKQVILLDGIYNLEELIQEYPLYLSFVQQAHNNKHDYVASTDFSFKTPFFTDAKKVYIVQSTNDELLSRQQSINLAKKLAAQGIKYVYYEQDFGLHNDVYQNQEVANIIAQAVSSV